MTNLETKSPVIRKFHMELNRMLDEEAYNSRNSLFPTNDSKVPKRRIVKLPPSNHPLFPDLSIAGT